MMKKTILGLGAAALIAAGSLAATTGAASASGVYVGGSGIYFGFGPHHHNHQVCKPIYKKVKWIDKWGHKHVKTKYVGQKCWWQPYHGWNNGWGPHW